MSPSQPPESVFTSTSRSEARERALVLKSVGISHVVRHVGGESYLLVEAGDVALARAELDAYEKENAHPPAPIEDLRSVEHANGWVGVLGYAVVLIAVSLADRADLFNMDWFTAGQTRAGWIREGQWWRTVTALTLHAGLPHLVGNIVIGGLFGLFVGKALGPGIAWTGILFAGAMGNLVNAYLEDPRHTSVGASTAVFAALGMFTGSMWHRRRHAAPTSLARWTPLVGGVVLLGYLGTAGVRTDVSAHVAGFASGLILGIVFARLGGTSVSTRGTQLLLGVMSVAVVAFAWAVALNYANR